MAIRVNSGVDLSVLFADNSTSKSGNSANSTILNLDLADVASVRNGSYGKLLKNYYKNQKTSGVSVEKTESPDTEVKKNADKLSVAAKALGASSLWTKKEVTEKDADGNEKTVKKLDGEAVSKAVKTFADAYNDTIKSAANSESKGVLRNAKWMDNMTRKNANLLSKAGITVNDNGTLTVDEEKVKTADSTTLQTLFSGFGSYADSVATKGDNIGNAAAAVSSLYTSGGVLSTTG